MADSDYDRDDDRPRRRDRDDDRPKKKKGGGMVILMVILGAVLLLCVAPCGVMIWWGMDIYNKMTGTAEDFLAKVGAGDYSGAYNSTTAAYKSKKTLEQFTADMKAAKLDKYQAKSFTVTASNSVNTTHRMSGQAKLTDGSSVPVTIVIEQSPGGFVFTVDDITATGVSGGTSTTPPTAK
jgi:flagellar basal body-associated protein FliL